MPKWTVLIGIVAAAVFIYKVHIEEVTFVDVMKYVVENSVEDKLLYGEKPAVSAKTSAKKKSAKKIVIQPEIKKSEPLTIMAFGDIMLGRYVRVLMDENGKDYIFKQVQNPAQLFAEGADVVFGNLEGPIHGHGTKGGTAMVFSFNEDVAQLLKDYGFTMLSISNNHAMDQGSDGRQTTITALKNAGLGWCGHSTEPDPASVYYSEVNGNKFAFLCFHSATRYLDVNGASDLIREVRPNVDYLIVSAHWGLEYKHQPNNEMQIKPAHMFIDAGADFVIGHHPHVVQTFEVYNGKVIFYSLGNFIFDQYWSADTQEELGIGIVLERAETKFENYLKTKIYLFPMQSEKSQPRMMTERERAKWLEKFIGYGKYEENLQQQIRNGIIEIP